MVNLGAPTQAEARSEFFGGAGQNAMSRIMASALDPERSSRMAHYTRKFIKDGLTPMAATMKAQHLLSPIMSLKYQGTPLPIDSERLLEDLVIQTALRTRNAVNDLVSRGFVRPLPDIGVLTDVWKEQTNLAAAETGMSLAGGPEYDRAEFNSVGVPVPIHQKKFEFELRELLAAARNGTPLDTTHAERAAQIVAEAEENTLINGATITFNGFTLYGYRTHPQRLTDTASDFGTAANILPAFNNAMSQLRGANKTGPTIFYVSTTQFGEMLVDHKAESDKTALQRVLELPDIQDVKHNAFVPDGQMVGVVMDRTNVDLAIAQTITSVPWEMEGGARQVFRVFSSQVPRLKKDADNQLGIVHISGI